MRRLCTLSVITTSFNPEIIVYTCNLHHPHTHPISVQKPNPNPVEEKPVGKAKKAVAKGKTDAGVAQNGQVKNEVGDGFLGLNRPVSLAMRCKLCVLYVYLF